MNTDVIAAFLFKIATRRAHRLTSPRPGELSAMLTEITTRLCDEARRCYGALLALAILLAEQLPLDPDLVVLTAVLS